MMPDYQARLRALATEKALAIAAYGESVAAYRYRTLGEKTSSHEQRKIFTEMADEEQGHHQRLQALLRRRFPGSDFVLSSEDKELVTVGPRMLEVTDSESFRRAMELIHDSELQTGRFYAGLYESTEYDDLKSFLKEMADECFEHAERLRQIHPLPQ